MLPREDEGVKLDYNYLLLQHLNRVSSLSSTVQGQIVSSGGVTIHYREKDRENAFAWAISVFDALVPSSLRDEQYKDTTTNLKTGVEGDMERLRQLVNLLARKGYLFELQQEADL